MSVWNYLRVGARRRHVPLLRTLLKASPIIVGASTLIVVFVAFRLFVTMQQVPGAARGIRQAFGF
ncbi:hypothetical protein [Aurantimonas sp. VKM B-3413]|uniref:hypothetical protein n=1 Tax=Aurantimonas sp. VKM B-3413 TaxID=2779401 RepID=UPI001E53C4EE|nr:hypothetical protein [Aurantimonas sp. VKM B-3413]MCB8840514.1 hypothetical protein [Aurantimonas sp. VKM B-3413]